MHQRLGFSLLEIVLGLFLLCSILILVVGVAILSDTTMKKSTLRVGATLEGEIVKEFLFSLQESNFQALKDSVNSSNTKYCLPSILTDPSSIDFAQLLVPISTPCQAKSNQTYTRELILSNTATGAILAKYDINYKFRRSSKKLELESLLIFHD